MKKFLLPLLMLIVTTVLGQSSGITFVNDDWQKVQAKAKETNKPIFLYGYTLTCQFCKKMEKTAFLDSLVSSYYNRTFINYKINIEEGIGKELAKMYGIQSFPKYLYFDPTGNLIHISGSAKSAEAFIGDAKDAFNPKKAFFMLKATYDGGDRRADLLYDYSMALHTSSQSKEAYNQVTAEYLKTQTQVELRSKKNMEFLFDLYTDFSSPTTQYFLEHQKNLRLILERRK